jgi:hypothetical protein
MHIPHRTGAEMGSIARILNHEITAFSIVSKISGSAAQMLRSLAASATSQSAIGHHAGFTLGSAT